ncbi:MAG: tRNA (N(6)-L-threonylcarbamoyladenosine(37)-C(2))-methylthiotransferase MtaB [Candidatus Polarisedimenticolia bacterium]
MSVGLHVTTLGCKLNQFDSAELAGALRGAASLVDDPAAARVIVVNTCTVTAPADADARQILRRRRRESPHALIVATGCYAERDPAALAAIPEVDLVLRREDRPRAARLILDMLRQRDPASLADGCAEREAEECLPDFGDRSRAFLRVQEGCDLVCSYCIIPSVRGASRSVEPGRVEERFRRILQAGYREVVLTGVNTGDYGRDLSPRLTLLHLLERLLRVEGDYRIRLNSVEPRRVTPGLIQLIAAEPRLARHLQVPLQSGSDAVLRDMRRNYHAKDYLETAARLRGMVPDIGLGADVIVGFPTEGEAEFEQTRSVLISAGVTYLHVFTWSPRAGTPAASLKPRSTGAQVHRRGEELRALGRELSAGFVRGQAGRTMRALVLSGRRNDGRQRALTSNFIEVALDGDAPPHQWKDVTLRGMVDGVPGAA